MTIIRMQQRQSLKEAGLRVVKRKPKSLVLTDGKKLELWRECSRFARVALTVQGRDYAFVRSMRAIELYGSWS